MSNEMLLLDNSEWLLQMDYASKEVVHGVTVLVVFSCFSLTTAAGLSFISAFNTCLWTTDKHPYLFIRTHVCALTFSSAYQTIQVAAYFISLLLSDLIQAIRPIMNARWIRDMAVVIGDMCTLQDFGCSYRILDPRHPNSYVLPPLLAIQPRHFTLWTLIAGWSGIGLIVIAGPATQNSPCHGPFCRCCSVLYTLIFLRFHGNIMVKHRALSLVKTFLSKSLYSLHFGILDESGGRMCRVIVKTVTFTCPQPTRNILLKLDEQWVECIVRASSCHLWFFISILYHHTVPNSDAFSGPVNWNLIFSPELIQLGYYTEENAETWVEINKFFRWVGHRAQKSTGTPLSSRATHLSQPLPPSSPIPATSSPLPEPSSRSKPAATERKSLSKFPTSSPILVGASDEEHFPPEVPLAARGHKRPRRPDPKDKSDSDCAVVQTIRQKGKRCKQDHDQEISKQLPWLDSKNELLSMAAIIKSEDQDSWGGGSGGSIKKPTKVTALTGALCQVATHNCQGVWVCSKFDTSLLEGHERYKADNEEMRELFEAERDDNVRETSSVAIRAAAFYKEIHLKKCPHIDASTSTQCTGIPVYRKLKEMNLDGKHGFIGCQNYRAGQARTHRFVTIHRNVKEEYIRELLLNSGIFESDVGLDPSRLSVHVFFLPEAATIWIFSPVERSDHRAIIHLDHPHNHPKFPSTKVSRQGKDANIRAVTTAGITGVTILKLDTAQSTSKIFGGQIPARLDPALANPRIKRRIIQGVKGIHNPCGMGIKGVLAWQKQMKSLPNEKQYVLKVTLENGEEIIITMLPYTAFRPSLD
ncbi:hypothetical protein DFH07DRAFT_980337 [Mycena maculata]|uniref:Uncharacterized protein n=1 Tax=Mycena maculata TaxID=230809 RepID=A0AAD7IH93_9AGAR|nr:hypothetical protein DFH07DRAFT_980337 [Mycena maculata]